MQMSCTYGIFDDEADHIIALVRQHAPLEEILAVPCPACGSKISLSFEEGGTGFTLCCEGDPAHMTKCQDIKDPPSWWRKRFEEPRDTTWYWRACHAFDSSGTLHMAISGWQADGTRWSGQMDRPVDHPEYNFWKWLLSESGCTKALISDTELEKLRDAYANAK
jgi:hypothetical protein